MKQMMQAVRCEGLKKLVISWRAFPLLYVALFAFSAMLGLNCFASDGAPSLRIEFTGTSEKPKALSVQKMKKISPEKIIKILSPEFHSTFEYRAVSLKDLLKSEAKGNDFDEIVFICSDGYRSPLARDTFNRLNLFLAFGEKGVAGHGGWTMVEHAKSQFTPGPFYVISSDPKEYETYNWPYQVVALELVNYKKRYASILPNGLDATPASASVRGFQVFRKQCIRCHSINLIGGEVGPELNTPKNVLEYMDRNYIRQFIRNPSAFRAKDKMPPFAQLKDEDINDIFAYLEEMGTRKSP